MKIILFLSSLPIIFSSCAMLYAQHGSGNESQLIAENSGEDEVFEGSGIGYRGPLNVQVRMRNGYITEILVVESAEDRFVGEAAIEELIDLVTEYNSTDVDAVSGATESSRGFLEAVQDAIMKK